MYGVIDSMIMCALILTMCMCVDVKVHVCVRGESLWRCVLVYIPKCVHVCMCVCVCGDVCMCVRSVKVCACAKGAWRCDCLPQIPISRIVLCFLNTNMITIQLGLNMLMIYYIQ